MNFIIVQLEASKTDVKLKLKDLYLYFV